MVRAGFFRIVAGFFRTVGSRWREYQNVRFPLRTRHALDMSALFQLAQTSRDGLPVLDVCALRDALHGGRQILPVRLIRHALQDGVDDLGVAAQVLIKQHAIPELGEPWGFIDHADRAKRRLSVVGRNGHHTISSSEVWPAWVCFVRRVSAAFFA